MNSSIRQNSSDRSDRSDPSDLSHSAHASTLRPLDYTFIAIIMTLMGGFFWAIRGTGGFGGEQGGMLAGLGWATLWYGFSRLDGAARTRPYGHAGIIAAITFGIAVGGFTGYGVYTAWVRGQFFLDHPNGPREIAPWTGYAMLFLCGIHWGGLAGAFMAWCAPTRCVCWRAWTARIGLGVCGAVAAAIIVRTFPQWFLPFYSEGIYQVAANKTCIRAEDSIRTIAPHLGLFLGFLAFEIIHRDWRAVGIMLVMSLGFAIPFSVGGWWHTMNGSPILAIDWWKNWEMSIGLGGGLTFGLAFYLFNRPEQTAPRPVTAAERFAGAGVPITLALTEVLLGGYDGFTKLHKLPVPELPDISPVLVIAGIGIVAMTGIFGPRNKGYDSAPVEPLATWTLFAIIAIIIAIGYLVSIPPQIKLANTFLLTLYTAYIAISALLTTLLLRRN